MPFRRLLTCFTIFLLCNGLFADSTDEKLAAMTARLATLEARFVSMPGYGLNTQLNRQGMVNLESVLLPPEEVEKVFGKDISNNLAVVRITLSNTSRDASFVLKMISIDYSNWLLSSCDLKSIVTNPPFALTDADQPTAVGKSDGAPTDKDAPAGKDPKDSKQTDAKQPAPSTPKGPELQLKDVDAYAYPCRVATMEVRDVRQIAKLGQTNSWRNRTDRSLRGAGTIAGALTGVFRHGLVFPRILAAYEAGVIPVFEDIFKDPADDQINLINDLAFRINLLVPKESSISVTGFFPMKRFLRSELAELFRKEPALFFAPEQYLLNLDSLRAKNTLGLKKAAHNYDKLFLDLLARSGEDVKVDSNTTVDSLSKRDMKILRGLLQKTSLNNVFVVATGEFVADVGTVAAQITGVTFDKSDISAFGQAGSVTGTIAGTLLDGADPQISNDKDLGLSIKKVDQGSDAKNLKFTLTLTKPVPPDASVQFVAVKKNNGREVSSNTFEQRITYTPVKPVIDSKTLTGKPGDKIEITGQNFYDIPPRYPLSVRFTTDGKGEPALTAKEVTWESPVKIQVTIPDGVGAQNQKIQVRVGDVASDDAQITVSKKQQ